MMEGLRLIWNERIMASLDDSANLQLAVIKSEPTEIESS